MLYLCGILSHAPGIKKLSVEVLDDYLVLSQQMQQSQYFADWPFQGLASPGFAGNAGLSKILGKNYDIRTEPIIQRAKFYLRPLALVSGAGECEVVLPSVVCGNPELITLKSQCELAVTSDGSISLPYVAELREQYIMLLDDQERYQKRQHVLRTFWDDFTCARIGCLHTNGLITFLRSRKGRGICDGCERWKRWLLNCPKCEKRACFSCTRELKRRCEAWLKENGAELKAVSFVGYWRMLLEALPKWSTLELTRAVR